MLIHTKKPTLSEYRLCIKDLLDSKTVKSMKEFKHHQSTTCFTHCMKVSYNSYVIAKKLGIDYVACARGGLLHDLFLYDWKIDDPSRKGLHGFTHPKTALQNASLVCDLSRKEKDIIIKHMWPLTLSFPKYWESYVVTFVDKACALKEVAKGIDDLLVKKNTYRRVLRYAYILMAGILLHLI